MLRNPPISDGQLFSSNPGACCRLSSQISRDSQGTIPIPTSPSTIDDVHPDHINLISQIVFPLLAVQSGSWSLFLGRVSASPNLSNSEIRKPASHIQIFHSVALGNTANIAQTYRLVKSLKVLKAWIDQDFRKWWNVVLDVDGEGDDEREDRSN
ncbi:hypothetical protein BDU57DRAFT_238094 [Ampelomyces quisqualis]|uniref:PD-(D/E)XK nuclease-like domain-containing protein n=1 Tax=Ampelomyces quisqualis TaxID=50730 RepID=A0A6A5QMA3_AMPQU|nr:hypothetical protein BDU57DRAFT_238094 [Ampelomyces quisqualis]